MEIVRDHFGESLPSIQVLEFPLPLFGRMDEANEITHDSGTMYRFDSPKKPTFSQHIFWDVDAF
jgi:hypothetical protein